MVGRFQGCLVGLAVGDALGYPVEFLSRSELREQYPGGIRGFVPPAGTTRLGLVSDDTQMTMAVARALLAADPFDLDQVMAEVCKTFITWANSPENNRAPGPTCMEAIRRIERGTHWFASGDPYSKGCGAAMRAAPIGLLYHRHPEMLVAVARAVSICTHAHPTGVSSGIAAAAAVAAIVNGAALDALLDEIRAALVTVRGPAEHPEFQEIRSWDPLNEQLSRLDDVAGTLEADPLAAFDRLGGGWVGEEAVAGALYAFLRTPRDFGATVRVAANASQSDESQRGKGRCDSDSIACIAGSLSGAFNGLSGVPEEWQRDVEHHAELLELGEALARKAAEMEPGG